MGLKVLTKKMTLDSILSGFKKTLTKLDALIAAHHEDLAAKTQQIETLMGEKQELRSEVDAAIKARQNIEQLIN